MLQLSALCFGAEFLTSFGMPQDLQILHLVARGSRNKSTKLSTPKSRNMKDELSSCPFPSLGAGSRGPSC